jgi:putative membrane protein
MALDKKNINKDLILREKLALERTDMANDRTLLSFIRTGLYFSIAGISINELLQLSYGLALEISFWVIAVLIIGVGIIKYIRQKRKMERHKKNIGNYQLEWDEEGLT